MSHPSDDEWRVFAGGRLPGDRYEQLAAHLVECAACRQVLGDIADSVAPSDSEVRAIAPQPMLTCANPTGLERRTDPLAETPIGETAERDTDESTSSSAQATASQLLKGQERGEASATGPWLPEVSFAAPAQAADSTAPHHIGRYRVIAELGKGSFGRVYLARDDELERSVAIKVPHRHRITQLNDVVEYLVEARTVASLDHPHIVPVYDVGSTAEGMPFVVSKYIAEGDLGKRVASSKPSFQEAAEIVAALAETVHCAHLKGVVHRDIKPENVLIDSTLKPYLTDFGLALKEADFGRGAAHAGTPAYMSPEQAEGQGHRVDGRSDIFSLGVMLYELLVGRRPFRGRTLDELLREIRRAEARPLRQIDDTIPEKLERVCLRALAKSPADRYPTAKDLADDLRRAFPDPAAETRDRQIQELDVKNQQLGAEVVLQRELAAIDRHWQDQRERYKVQYGKNTAPVEPTLAKTIFASIATLVVMAIGMVMMSGFPGLGWFGLLWLGVGIAGPAYFTFKYVSFEQARSDYQHRRQAAERRYRESIARITASSSDTRPSEFISAGTDPSRLRIAPEERDDRLPQGGQNSLGWLAGVAVMMAAIISFVLFILPTSPGPPRSPARAPYIPRAADIIPADEENDAAALVQHLLSSDGDKRQAAARLLTQRPALAGEAVPLLARLLEQESDSEQSGAMRQQVHSLLRAYGPNAHEAAGVLAQQFRIQSSSSAPAAEIEAQETLRTLAAIGPNSLITAELPAMLASAQRDAPCLEVARLIATTSPETEISVDEMSRILEVLQRSLVVRPEGGTFPEQQAVTVLGWAVSRIAGLPADSARLHASLVALHATLQESLSRWNVALALLEASPPPRTRPARRRVRRRYIVTHRSNPEWDVHRRSVENARQGIDACEAADRAVVALLDRPQSGTGEAPPCPS